VNFIPIAEIQGALDDHVGVLLEGERRELVFLEEGFQAFWDSY
jgi:hypothetical protein